jgi:hypothetical protein
MGKITLEKRSRCSEQKEEINVDQERHLGATGGGGGDAIKLFLP